MRRCGALTIVLLAVFSATRLNPESGSCRAEEQPRGRDAAGLDRSWTKTLEDRAKRGTLHDVVQIVRGDSGKWNDEPGLRQAPPIQQKPAGVSLDDWFDQLSAKEVQLRDNDDCWLLFRTRQLDDHDRVWVERIERRGNQFNVVIHQAVWQGRYAKNFTYYHVFGVNLGKCEPGKYEVKCMIVPLAFSQFEGSGQVKDNWPKDDRPLDQKPLELTVPLRPAS